MVQITELGYLTLGVKRLARWKEFAAEILGLEVVEGDLPGRAYLRMDYWHHRILLEEDDADDLMLLGFRVAGQDEFGEMAKRLEAAGVKVRIGSFEEAAERHVLEVMMLEDPSGHPIEIFHGPHVQANRPFHPGRRMHGSFKTGAGGLGHVMHRQHRRLRQDLRLLPAARHARRRRIPHPGPRRCRVPST